MNIFQWYQRACARVEQFLPELDEELAVDVDETSVTPYDGSDEFATFVLLFSHPTNPNLNWTMSVKPDADFIEHELEGVVRRIYLERVE